jgi:DNA processing protein
MSFEDQERAFYHAIATAVGGDYAAIRRKKSDNLTWEDAGKIFFANGGGPDVEAAHRSLREKDIQIILFDDDRFPPLLREIPHPPFGIYVKGPLPENDQMAIAIVGTRRATPDGKSTARKFATDLARAGIAIVSGLAFGVDAAAHEGCLDAGGRTIAVLACGLGSVYPRNNEPLAQKILSSGGALISEYPPDEPAYPSRFLERNRVISGISKGTLVVEAPERSGSLATARFAFEQNRDVFVVPGPIAHPNFKGSNRLIRQGAELVTGAEDIFESYGVTREETSTGLSAETSEEKTILEFLKGSGAAADIDKIAEATRLEPRIVSRTVSTLFIEGRIGEQNDGYVIN